MEPELPLFVESSENPGLPERGKYVQNGDLSNMTSFEEPFVSSDGLSFLTPEHAYQAAKFLDFQTRELISRLGKHWPDGTSKDPTQVTGHVTKTFFKELRRNNFVFSATESQMSAKWGLPKSWIQNPDYRQTDLAGKPTFVLRAVPQPFSEWEARKEGVMRELLEHKYARGTKAEARLLASGSTEKVEWNNWGDRYWGRDVRDGVGENRLGVLTMEIRREKILELSRSSYEPERVTAAALRPQHLVTIVPSSTQGAYPIGKGVLAGLDSRHQQADFRDVLKYMVGAKDEKVLKALNAVVRLSKEEGGMLLGYDGTDEMLRAEVVVELVHEKLATMGRDLEYSVVEPERELERTGERSRSR